MARSCVASRRSSLFTCGQNKSKTTGYILRVFFISIKASLKDKTSKQSDSIHSAVATVVDVDERHFSERLCIYADGFIKINKFIAMLLALQRTAEKIVTVNRENAEGCTAHN